MADRCAEHPWGTCDRCGDDLQAQSACVPFGGYSTPCDPCVQNMLEERRKMKRRDYVVTKYYIREVYEAPDSVRVSLMTPADLKAVACMAGLRQSVVIGQGESEDAETSALDAIRQAREHICSL